MGSRRGMQSPAARGPSRAHSATSLTSSGAERLGGLLPPLSQSAAPSRRLRRSPAVNARSPVAL
jgi:hypothetical protein